MNKLLLIIPLIFLLKIQLVSAQENEKEEFQKMYTNFPDYDEDGNYRQMIIDLTEYIDKYPDYKGRLLTQILRRYKEKIMLDGDILTRIVKYKKFIPPDFIDVLLAAYYNENNVEKVQELLSELTTADPAMTKIQIELLLYLDPKINEEIYQQIVLNIKPYISFSPEPEKYVLYYNSGMLNQINRIYTGKSPEIPLEMLAKVNPEFYPELYFTFFSESLPNDAAQVINLIKSSDELFNMLLQYKIMDRLEAYKVLKSFIVNKFSTHQELYKLSKHLFVQNDITSFDLIQRRINDQINPADTIMAVKFNWAISSIYLRQFYRADQLLPHIFLYGKPDETEFYRKEIEWWLSNNLEPAYCKRFLAGIYGEYPIQTAEEIISPVIEKKSVQSGFGTNYALLIGVQDYKDPELPDLLNPIKDVKRFQDMLVNNYMFDPENIVIMENPARGEIVKQFYEYRNNLDQSDNLLVFYAGHGWWDPDIEQGYWLPSDANNDMRANWINNSDVRDYIKTIQSRHTLLITDACFSGAIFKQRDIRPVSNQNIENIYKHTSRKAITSGSLKEVPDESVFIEWLFKKLKENDKKYLTTAELFFSLKDAVKNNSQQVPLYGTIHNTGDDNDLGDFIFVKK